MQYFHNPRCSKSREGLALLKEKGINPTIVEYIKTPLTPQKIKEILQLLDISALEIMRKKEADYKSYVMGQELSEEELINALIKYPKLMERPIFVHQEKAVIGRPAEKLLEIL